MSAKSNDQQLLSINNLNLSIGKSKLLHDISFTIEKGKTLGLIGESGSGKSLTALSIMQLLPDMARVQGSINFCGRDLLGLPESQLCSIRGSNIGMVFQEPMTALNPLHTIGTQVVESIQLHQGLGRHDAEALAKKTLARVGLSPEKYPLGRFPHQLSGGQRQRVVIAIAVACKPELLIADEPTTALDVTTQASILELLQELQAEQQMGMLFISHDLGVVSAVSDKIIIMRSGKMVEQGETADLLGTPKESYSKQLLKASIDVLPREHSNNAAVANASTQSSNEVLLSVDSLKCRYPGKRGWFGRNPGFEAVRGISFSLNKGETLGLLGESGCGKSTLARAILGLMPIAEGKLSFDGEEVSAKQFQDRELLLKRQIVFQDPYGSFNPRHRVGRLVGEPLHLLGDAITPSEKQGRVVQAIKQVGLDESHIERFIHEFSGGQRQRLAIARALVLKPKLIVLDEAVSALDVSVRGQILSLLQDLREKHGLAYLFISHDLSVVEKVCDRVIVMRDGQIVESGNVVDVFAKPQQDYTKTLIEAIPRLPDYVRH